MGHHREFGLCAGRIPSAPNGASTAAILHDAHSVSHDTQLGHLLLGREAFQIRLARPGATNKSDALIYRMYTQRGYRPTAPDAALAAANEITLQACRDDSVFGTLTVRFDSSRGLGADALYRDEIDAYRRDGARVAELTRLAVDPEFGSKEVLGALFHLAYVFCGPVRNIDDVFIEVNPRHVPFYRRMLNFDQAGGCRMCPRVDAPAILMHVPVAYVGAEAGRWGGQHGVAARSLYPYFCTAWEEENVINRALALMGGGPGAMPERFGRAAQPRAGLLGQPRL